MTNAEFLKAAREEAYEALFHAQYSFKEREYRVARLALRSLLVGLQVRLATSAAQRCPPTGEGTHHA